MSQELILEAVRKKPCDSYLDEVVKFYRDDFLKKLPSNCDWKYFNLIFKITATFMLVTRLRCYLE